MSSTLAGIVFFLFDLFGVSGYYLSCLVVEKATSRVVSPIDIMDKVVDINEESSHYPID